MKNWTNINIKICIMASTKVNFLKNGIRQVGRLVCGTGKVKTAKGEIFPLEKLEDVKYYETHHNGILIKKEGRYEPDKRH